jgi:prephenate dehydrogenase
MKALNELTYGIVGLGIMGGSIAKAIRQNILSYGSKGQILACNRSTACLSQATSEGIVDGIYTSDEVQEMLPNCDVLFICLYPHATLDFIRDNKDFFKSGSIITDISGVKGIFEKAMPEILRPDVDFIIGHPMAGGEKEGYAHSSAQFFVNHNYILCPQEYNKPENISIMQNLITLMGFTRITETTCDIHDYKIGFTSQLCHVIASALVESAQDEGITAFGGGSFEDLTRIALINANLWTELFISNKEKLIGHIDNFINEMQKMKTLINSEDSAGLQEYLNDVRQMRTKMGSIRSVQK